MSAAVIIGTIAVLKVLLDAAYLVSVKQQEAQEAAERAPIPVASAGALPGEALAPLPTSPSAEVCVASSPAIATASSASRTVNLDPKDLFDPAEFLVVAHRRTTPQRDLFDREPAPIKARAPSMLDGMTIPDHADDWIPPADAVVDVSVEDEIYVHPISYDAFEPLET